MPILYGVPMSSFVRKAMLALTHKGISYRFQPAIPGSDDADFREASPLGKVPAFRTDDGFGFADSSVIIAYLEKTNSNNSLYPAAANDYAWALWLEEYGDTRMMEATGGLYFQKVIGPAYFGHTTDPERVRELSEKLVPAVLDYMESQLRQGAWLVGDELSVADLALASNLANLHYCDYDISPARWPKLADFKARLWALPLMQAQMELEAQAFAMA
ncbi:glutathione S-transferase family protein [Gallaecimonas kandeliae]|uniref:glutathione S-transferase family protein n=1 Tax=Gallaecimonas kandeliae TaxID=3029055 RepID=UPI0026486EC8|nr:glutathione S-transferase family protein [Gallaecimonas kandeliae]WKE66392.1 glutathione S-transferase family protein [Gallaecimonas kandeliae]